MTPVRDAGDEIGGESRGLPVALPELEALAALERSQPSELARIEVLATAQGHGLSLPVYAVTLGKAPATAPALVLVGGVHGLERIGCQVVLAFLESALARLRWDRAFRRSLDHARLVFVPLVNPVGMARGTRANGHGVDLMRNAPPHPDSWATPLVGGQRLSPRLPWYMGQRGAPMEPELVGLSALLERETFSAPASICLDAHSGFGMVDRLWFPYARTRRPPPHLAEIHAITELLDATLPNHIYRVEPQAGAYTIEGDFWDYTYDRFRAANPGGAMVPLTLEMGSWSWVRKNPRQLLSRLGSFDPVVPHRRQRTLRRHLALFDLLWHAVLSPDAWAAMSSHEREARERAAFARWYSG